ncbi:hypothetical protein AAFF_G00090340 [Aldrovandia affinis]|uniref:Uncharacterized protein n=1 Tax=Aldrovandia affinis TaxID=143900 RepID=A0AAD7RW20_9TELE|nr:hypothetical protein AAFF_G00090340 [Aldrovandia affinis]
MITVTKVTLGTAPENTTRVTSANNRAQACILVIDPRGGIQEKEHHNFTLGSFLLDSVLKTRCRILEMRGRSCDFPRELPIMLCDAVQKTGSRWSQNSASPSASSLTFS